MSQPYLQMKRISKTFPGVKALDDVNFKAHLGEVHALLGENGAGKSTLVKILSGVHKPDSGEILIDGQSVLISTTKDAERLGIAIIYQELNLIPQMTVAENIYLGREPINRLRLIKYRKMKADAAHELKQLAVDISPDTPVGQLRIGQQQLVEITKALSLHAKIVIMDEPTSALSDAEVEILFNVIRRLKDSGVAIIYITHKLDEIFAIAQKVTVLRDGKYIGTRSAEECDSSILINMMVGRELENLFPKQIVSLGEELLRVEDLTVKHPTIRARNLISNISFNIHGGEILGIAGLMGSGRTELLMSLFGAPPGEIVAGRFFIKGKQISLKTPVDAIQNKLALVTEDRQIQGLFLQLSAKINISITSLKQAVRLWFLRHHLEANMVKR